MMIKKFTMIVVACLILRLLVKLRFPPECSISVNHFMWANYCRNGFVKVSSTRWQFIYMVENFSISTLEVLHCSFHNSLLFSCILTLSQAHPLFNPILLGRFAAAITLGGGGFHSPLLCFFAEKVAMIIKLGNEMHFDANNQIT